MTATDGMASPPAGLLVRTIRGRRRGGRRLLAGLARRHRPASEVGAQPARFGRGRARRSPREPRPAEVGADRATTRPPSAHRSGLLPAPVPRAGDAAPARRPPRPSAPRHERGAGRARSAVEPSGAALRRRSGATTTRPNPCRPPGSRATRGRVARAASRSGRRRAAVASARASTPPERPGPLCPSAPARPAPIVSERAPAAVVPPAGRQRGAPRRVRRADNVTEAPEAETFLLLRTPRRAGGRRRRALPRYRRVSPRHRSWSAARGLGRSPLPDRCVGGGFPATRRARQQYPRLRSPLGRRAAPR